MTLEDILKFKVLFYSPDGKFSPIVDYITGLNKVDSAAAIKCTDELQSLPFSVYNRAKNIKSFIHPKYRLFELKVKHKNNEFRFFFIIEHPNLVVVYGFTKKTQKTDKKDINVGTNYLELYFQNKRTIKPFDKS
jgi:phage-related protein